MNFLGHCLLTQYNPELISGNLGGDHFKGELTNFSDLPDAILKGITIHRFIDSFTDGAPEIRSVAQLFREKGVKRVSFIASDIILDHFISKNWSDFSTIPLPDFISQIYDVTSGNLKYFPSRFNFIFDKMKRHNWLANYQSLEGISMTLKNFEQVIPFNNNLYDAFAIYCNHTEEIDALYKRFMTKIINTINTEFNLNRAQT